MKIFFLGEDDLPQTPTLGVRKCAWGKWHHDLDNFQFCQAIFPKRTFLRQYGFLRESHKKQPLV